jgi:hypothetical protein
VDKGVLESEGHEIKSHCGFFLNVEPELFVQILQGQGIKSRQDIFKSFVYPLYK